MIKKKDHAETEQRRRTETKENENVNDIRRKESKSHGCALPKRWRIEPDPDKNVKREVLNVPQEP